MKIVKLHKPQRMGNWESVIAYAGEEEDPNANALADPDSTATDSTGVTTTGRGFKKTIEGENSRITFTLETFFGHKDGAGDDPDSTMINIPAGPLSIEIAIPRNPNPGPPSPPYMGPGPVEYDQFGRPLYH